MRLNVGMPTSSTDGPWGELADIVIDPVRRRVTHLIVQPDGRHDQARLIPVEAVATCDERVTLVMSPTEIERSPTVQESDFLPMGSWPEPPDGWDIGISRVLAWPYYGAGLGLGMASEMGMDGLAGATTTYDRIPPRTAEIRRTSQVISSDNHLVGHVDGFVVDIDHGITHLVLDHGHLWGHREVTIPIGEVTSVVSDVVHLRVAKDEIGSFPSIPFVRHHHGS